MRHLGLVAVLTVSVAASLACCCFGPAAQNAPAGPKAAEAEAAPPNVEAGNEELRREKATEAVKASVKKMCSATADGNWGLVVDMTHPNVIEDLGGKAKAREIITAQMEAIKRKGVTMEFMDFGEPTVLRGDRKYFAVAPYTMVMTGAGKRVTMKTAVVGESTDGEKDWTFISLGSGGETKLRERLPDLPRELKIPRQESVSEDVK